MQLSQYEPAFSGQGLDTLVAGGRRGEGLQAFKVTQVGASPFAGRAL